MDTTFESTCPHNSSDAPKRKQICTSSSHEYNTNSDLSGIFYCRRRTHCLHCIIKREGDYYKKRRSRASLYSQYLIPNSIYSMDRPISQQSWSSFRDQYGSNEVQSGSSRIASRTGTPHQQEYSRVYCLLGGILSVLNVRRQRQSLPPPGKRRLLKIESFRRA